MKHVSTRKLISLALTALMLVSGMTIMTRIPAVAEEKTVVITLDPGHGPKKTGTNGAVEYGGINEHFYTYSMATYAKERLEQYKGVEVYLTRTADNTPELSERPQAAADRNSDAFVSIHINAANKKAGGLRSGCPTTAGVPRSPRLPAQQALPFWKIS